jgi:broad specificity phosphatase PhoE
VILYLVRHGRTLDAEGRCIGHCDLEMDPAAAAGLAALAESLAVPPRRVTSDLSRARATLAALAEGPHTLEPRLREMDFGEWDGRHWAEIQAQDGRRLRRWMDAWVETPAPGGESFAQVAARTAAWLAEVAAEPAEDVLAVAHAGSIRALLCGALGLPLERAFRLRVDHGRVSALELGPAPTLRFLNCGRVPR